MLTDDTLRKVRETARIDEVASGYLTLHRSGKDFVALCPFHDERHPSFRVSPARNIGKCFSCGEAADPIRLVCHMEGCGFEEAVRLLARKYNIEVEETAAAGRERRRDEREALLLANASFASGLLPGHPVGTTRTEEDRHGLEETYCGFGVGLCPPDVPQVFRPFLGRLIFPIHTTGGQVAGFAGRSLTPSEKGRKYVNSPDSPAYHKGHILYGLHKAVKAVRSEGRILLCEGYKDVLAFHASGIRYAVGLCGTALTEEHIRAIRRLAGQVTLSLDPDPAGQQNTVRCAHMLLSEGCAVSLLPLPDGMDPDEVYRRKGSDELARLAREGTLDYLSYRIRQAASRPHTDTAAINGTLGEIGLLSSPLAVYRRIGELSGATGIPIEVLRQEISVATGPKNVPVPVPKKEAAGLTPALPRERTLLRFCLTHHDRMFYDPDGNGISLPAWVSGELADNELPLEDPEHARLLHLLAEGKHPDGIADERLSALVLSLRASAPQDTGPVLTSGFPTRPASKCSSTASPSHAGS
ncbi:MAG: DNA primase [Parabacteroides distasonis]